MSCKDINEIKLEDVNFSYGDRKLYAKGVNACFKKGNVYLLSGRNGCGKSTLVNILLKIWRNYEGNIWIDGKNLKDFSRNEISEVIGLSFQKTPIFHDTIKNNICLGKEGCVEKLLPILGFVEDLRVMDRTLDSWLKDSSSLSGGQAQKIGILRTLFYNRAVYIFDEATANLDIKSKKEFFQIIKKLRKNHIILLISHEEDVEEHIDEIIEIKGGIERCI